MKNADKRQGMCLTRQFQKIPWHGVEIVNSSRLPQTIYLKADGQRSQKRLGPFTAARLAIPPSVSVIEMRQQSETLAVTVSEDVAWESRTPEAKQ